MELLSVIIPVYNVEKYLRECLDSVLASTYPCLEILVVDDGSTDSCPQICDDYAKADVRIRVIHQNNHGLIAARNRGLAEANGAYIGFVDSDDVISPVMFAELIKAIENTNADMAACEYCVDKCKLAVSEITEESYVVVDSFEGCLSVITVAPEIRNTTWTGQSVWNKLYRRELIHNLYNPDCFMCEDLRFNWDYIHGIEKMVVIPKALYMYRQNENSILATYRNKKKNEKSMFGGVANSRLWGYIADEPKITYETLREYIKARAAYVTHGALFRVCLQKRENDYKEFVDAAKRIIKSNECLVRKDVETYSLKVRTIVWLCGKCFPLWKLGVKLVDIFGK
ncbi:MAG: glycosyltransferase [Ruminococcaceae bacterium]|nr:glycosyltransferase [Oscillospiraceae bacterium]